MLYFFNRLNTRGSLDLYVTGSQAVVSKLEGKPEKARAVSNFSLADFIAHFNVREPEVRFEQTQYAGTVRCPEPDRVREYLEKALEMSGLDDFNPEQAKWEEEKKENLAELERRKAQKGKSK